MQILPIDPAFQRVILQGNRSPEGLQLTLGQQIAATVLKINEEGQLLLGFGTQKVWARSDFPFIEGQQLQLRVNQNGATVELQLLNTTADEAVENYELATLLQASGGNSGAATSESDPLRLLEALKLLLKTEGQLLTEPQTRQLKAPLEPVIVGADAKTLLPQIKNLIENSGVFFEAKLRTVLEALNASPEAALQKVASDLKLLLGQLQQPPSPSASSTQPGALPATSAASLPPSLPAETTTVLEHAPTPAVTTKSFQSEALPNLPARPSAQPECLAALQALLGVLKESPDPVLQKLSTQVSALLPTAKPEQFLAPVRTHVAEDPLTVSASQSKPQFLAPVGTNATEGLLKQAGLLSATTQTSTAELPAHQKQLALQSGVSEPLSTPIPHPSSRADGPLELNHRVAQLLEAVRVTPEPESRKLLPELAALLIQTKEQTSPAPPAEAALAHSRATVLEQTAVLSDQVLSRQTESAFEWLKNGALQAEVPMQFGTHSTQAKIRFFQEKDKQAKGQGRPLNINIYLDLPDTGKLEAWARWEGSQIQATLYVRDTETRELFESQLEELSANLREAGFSTAVLDVTIDPARLYKIQESAEQALPPEGSLLSLRV
jgi:Flagellar hook-length control protein FliK